MVKRMLTWILGAAVLLLSPVEAGQDRFRMGSRGPTTMHVQHLSELLRLEAPVHELLVELHVNMLRTEDAAYQSFRQKIDDMDLQRANLGLLDEWGAAYGEKIDRAAEEFYRDAKLLGGEADAAIVEHIERRLNAERLIRQQGYDISGLMTHPFELLFRERIVDGVRFGELLREHMEADQRLGVLMERTAEALDTMGDLYKDFGYDITKATPAQIRALGNALKEEIDLAKRLRKANEDLAAAIIESLGGEDVERYEQAWLLANYGEVQEDRIAERAVIIILSDLELDASTRNAIEEMKKSYGDRLRIARRMARVAKHRSDLDYTMENLINETEPDTRVYDASLERIDRIAESYRAALRGVLTPKQRVASGLDVEGKPS